MSSDGQNVRGFAGPGSVSVLLASPLLAILLLAILLLPVTFANAQTSSEPEACLKTLGADARSVPFEWRAVIDAEAGWAVRLPPSHHVGRSEDIWYIFETHDGAPLVPDVSVQLHRGQSVEETAAARFGEAVRLEPLRMGPATLGYRVSARPDAGAEGYLAATEAGVYSISRYEGFDWDGFDRVACSFHFVERVEGAEAED